MNNFTIRCNVNFESVLCVFYIVDCLSYRMQKCKQLCLENNMRPFLSTLDSQTQAEIENFEYLRSQKDAKLKDTIDT